MEQIIEVNMVMIPQKEYEKLKKENFEMKTKILELFDNRNTVEQITKNHTELVNEFRIENDMIKNNIKKLVGTITAIENRVENWITANS